MTNSSASLTSLALQTLPAYLLSYQSPAQRSMHRIPGSLNGPNKAIAKHLEIFRSDTDTTLALHMAAFLDEWWHDTLLDHKADTYLTRYLAHLIVVFTERVMVSVIDS